MEFNSDRKKDEKNKPEEGSLLVGSAGSSKIPPFEKKEVDKNNLEENLMVRSAGSSKPPPSPPDVHVQVPQDGKLLVKLKIPKSTEEIEEGFATDHGINRVVDVKKKEFSHVCKECNKGFNSGKALGGHMSSAHVQAKDYNNNLKKLKIKKSDGFFRKNVIGSGITAAADRDEEHKCLICGKEFPSSKSLYGHMRLHPERHWRGMEPPPSSKSLMIIKPRRHVDDDDYNVNDQDNKKEEDRDVYENSDEDEVEEEEEKVLLENFDNVDLDDDDDDDDSGDEDGVQVRVRAVDKIDFADSLSGWGVTGKRGRQALKSETEIFPVSDEERQRVYEAVSQLIRLVNIRDSSKTEDPEEEEANEVTRSKNSSIPSAELIRDVHPARDSKDFPLKKRKFSQIAESDDDSEETLDGTPNKARALSEFSAEKSFGSQRQQHSRDFGLCSSRCDDSKNFSATDRDLFAADSSNAEEAAKIHPVTMVGKKRRKEHKVDLEAEPRSGKTKRRRRKDHEVDLEQPRSGETTPVGPRMNPELDVMISEKHKCSTCKKIFPSHQALGGHRSSHNKVKIHVQNAVDDHVLDYRPANIPVARLLEWNEIEGNDNIALKAVSENVYFCDICGKTFPSGQALGGHKRCHYSATSSGQAASSPDNQRPPDQKSERKVLEFDLNVKLDEEDDDHHHDPNVAAGYGCS